MTTYPLPGYVGNVASSARIESTWQKAIRDRTAQIFDTYAHLVAGLTPQVGQFGIVTADGASTGIYEYVGATDGWTKPWNTSWGEVARTVDTTLQSVASATETTITAAATAFAAVANRKYQITVDISLRNLAAAAASLTIRVKDGTTLIEQARIVGAAPINNTGDVVMRFSVETTLTVGAHTINLTMQSGNASGVSNLASNYPIVVAVNDIGPSGAPS